MIERIVFQPLTTAKAAEVNYNFEKIFSGDFHQKLPVWNSETRPETPQINRTIGFNTDYLGMEIYIDAEGTGKWLIINGRWTTHPNAVEGNLAPGSMGFNYNNGQWEGYTGKDGEPDEWVFLG